MPPIGGARYKKLVQKGLGKTRVAVARKLGIRLWIPSDLWTNRLTKMYVSRMQAHGDVLQTPLILMEVFELPLNGATSHFASKRTQEAYELLARVCAQKTTNRTALICSRNPCSN
jgi:hypothetical protein